MGEIGTRAFSNTSSRDVPTFAAFTFATRKLSTLEDAHFPVEPRRGHARKVSFAGESEYARTVVDDGGSERRPSQAQSVEIGIGVDRQSIV